MSGFEIAGIVLAAFSILVDAGKDSKGIVRKARNWWSFGLAFEDFMLRLDTERVAFLQNLDILLSSTDISEERREILKNDISSQLWKDRTVQDNLKHRIGPLYYDWYITVLKEIHQALRETMDLLPVNEIEKIDASGTANVLFRLKTSFSSRKEKLLDRIQDRNEEIFKFLSRESIHPEHVAPKVMHSSRTAKESKALVQSQKESQDLYQSLLSVWKCKCSPRHLCSIGIVLHDRNTNIRLLLQDTASISVIHARPPSEKLGIFIPQEQAQARATSLQSIVDLRCQVGEKNISKTVSSAKAKGILRRMFQKGTPEKRVTFSVTAPSPATSTEPSRSLPPIDSTKPDSIIVDICGSLSTATLTTDSTPLGSIGRSPPATRENAWEFLLAQREAYPGTTTVQALGLFLAKTQARHERMEVGLDVALNLLSLSQTWIPPDLDKTYVKTVRLEQGLMAEPPRPATYLWHPHLFLPSQVTSVASVGPAEHTRRCLLALGIILLESLFGQTLEAQPYRSQFFGPDGKPNAYTDMCTAMEWQKRVELEVGDGIPQAIQRCVECDFGTERDLSNPKFVQAVVELVVVPVRQFLSRWNSWSSLR